MINRVIVFGPTGMLGRYVVKYLSLQGQYNVVPIDRTRHDILADGTSRLWNLFESKYNLGAGEHDVVINCAGLIKQRNNFTKKELIEVNTMFPHDLAMMSKECGFKVIHITTDCVFSGLKNSSYGYTENDDHDALDDYGKSKSLGEASSNCNIRTSIIGEELNNKLSLLEWAKLQTGKKVTGYNDIWNGVTCLQLAKYISYIIDNDLFWQGTRHYFTNINQENEWFGETERIVERISKYGLLKEISNVYDLKLIVEPVLDIRNVGLRRDLDTIYPLEELLPTGSFQKQLEELRDFKICE